MKINFHLKKIFVFAYGQILKVFQVYFLKDKNHSTFTMPCLKKKTDIITNLWLSIRVWVKYKKTHNNYSVWNVRN
jgi:hypothetical protein